MEKKKKIFKGEALKSTMKRPYEPPQLIIHGSLQDITGKLGGNTDGSGLKSH
jgi:hypothetical protein